MATFKKFTPDRGSEIKGFWVPSKGASLRGIVTKRAQRSAEAHPYLVLRLTQAQELALRSLGGRGTTRCNKGDLIGVSEYADLKGLHRHTSCETLILCSDVQQLQEDRHRYVLSVEISEDFDETEQARNGVPF
jgi:hypothetical protein